MRTFVKVDSRLHFEKLSSLYDEPVVIRVNEFDEEALEDFEEDMTDAHNTGQPVIPIIIDSYGGSAYGVLGFIAAVEAAKVPVATIVTTKAMSAGACLFCFGTEGYRFMHPHANIMIHDVGSVAHGKIEEIKATTEHLKEINESLNQRMSKHIGQKADFISKLIKDHNHTDWFLTSKEAKKLNIANHLRIPSFEVEINLNLSFV